MDLSRLEELKRLTLEATDFGVVLEYFFDHFGDHFEFSQIGERTREPILETIIQQTGNQVFGKVVNVSHVLLTRLPDHGFVHGGFMLDGNLGTLFFFDEVDTGLMVISMSASGNDTRLIRFRGHRVSMPDPSDN